MDKILRQIMYVVAEMWKDVTIFGSLVFFGFLVVFMAAFGEYLFAFKLILALFVAYVLIIVIRLIYYKERPNKQKFSNFVERLDSSSFPSVHSTRSSILFVLFWINYGVLVSGVFFILLFLVSVSRVVLKKHYLVDVIAGIFVGALIGIGVEVFL